MKKRLLSIFIIGIVLLPFIVSASAFSEEEALVRKRAYYAGIESALSLLSKNLGTLENVQIQKIVVESPKDFTAESDIKEFTVAEAQKESVGDSVNVWIQFSASENGSQEEYLFSKYLTYGTMGDIDPLTTSGRFKLLWSLEDGRRFLYNAMLDALDPDQGKLVAPGIAYYMDKYLLDIDLSDYQDTGHSLSIPLQKSGDSASALFPLIRKRAYYRNVEQALSALKNTYTDHGLSNIQVKQIIVQSTSDCTSEADVDKLLEECGKNSSAKFYIFILCSALKGNSTQDCVFGYTPYTSDGYFPNSSSENKIFLSNFNYMVMYLDNYGTSLAPGIAYVDGLGYYLDIDLSDYQAQGYSLLIAG